MAKGSKKRRRDEPTHDELRGYAETETLFKSNLFRLQTVELLREVAPFSGTPLTRLESAVRALRGELLSLPSAELSSEPRAGAPSVAMPWRAPAKVDLVGSYLLRTTTAPELNVDVAIQLPAGTLLEKDYLDQRYADKRLLYLTHLAKVLLARAKAPASQSVVSSATPPRFVALPHMQAHRWPVLEVHLRDASAPSSGGDGATTTGSREVGGWVVRLLPCLADDTFPQAKLRPQRCNLRSLGARPSPVYNNLVRLELGGYRRALALLHHTMAKDSNGALREAVILLKVWARQRYSQQAGSVSGFQLSLVLTHLLATRAINYEMGSYHMLRVTLAFLSKGGLAKGVIRLPGMPAADADADADEDEDEEAKAQSAKAAAAAAATFASYFPCVLTDSDGAVNYGCGVSRGALKELAADAALSLAALDAPAVSDAASFAALFTSRRALCASFDALLTMRLPPTNAPPPAANGAVALPAVAANDPTEGEPRPRPPAACRLPPALRTHGVVVAPVIVSPAAPLPPPSPVLGPITMPLPNTCPLPRPHR